jgi:6-phosphofructokinase 1
MDAVVAQCGAPTAVVNASLAAVIEACRRDRRVGVLWGARLGLRGLASGDWVDLSGVDERGFELQPGAVLGAGRDRLAQEAFARIGRELEQRRVGLVVLIGGNGTMTAASALAEEAAGVSVVAIPKTIDNDIASTDVAPGYASAARFVARSVRDAGLDLYSMRGFDDVAVLEVMGRHAGWLAAASALGRYRRGSSPHVLLFPEVPFSLEPFLAAVADAHAREGICVVVTAEGARDAGGAFLAEREHPAARDASGQKLLGISGGPAPFLTHLVQERLRLQARQMRPDVIQRSSSELASPVDRTLARLVGEAAVLQGLEGRSGVMIALERRGSEWGTRAVALREVAGREKTLPAEFIAPDGFDVTQGFLDWARPLVGEPFPEVVTL